MQTMPNTGWDHAKPKVQIQQIITIVGVAQAAALQLPARDRAPCLMRQWCLEMQV